MNGPALADQPPVQQGDSTREHILKAIERFEDAKSSRQIMLEADAASLLAPQDLVGRFLRVYWTDDDAWYAGHATSYDPETGKHGVDYQDGTHEDITAAIERIRLVLDVGVDPPRAATESLNEYAVVLRKQAEQLKSEDPEKAALLCRRADELLLSAAPQASTSAAAAAAAARDPLLDELKPGDVVWAHVKGYPPWPGLVVTREQNLMGKSITKNKKAQTSIPIVYFGTAERYWNAPSSITRLREGLDQGFHLADKEKCRSKRQFGAAIAEMCDYLTEGEIPEAMFPCNDEPESDLEDESDDEGKGRVAKRQKSGGSTWCRITKDPGMPLEAGKGLRVLSLGNVEWLHPGFHDEKSIWPVGYRAERLAVTPASGGQKPLRHLCEVLAAQDDSGPIFRVTPWNKEPVEGRTPNQAWSALFESPASDSNTITARIARIPGSTGGSRQFGFTLPIVAGAIMGLPNAFRCERFAGWPDDSHPIAPPPLTQDEMKRRLIYEAAACKLPSNVQGTKYEPKTLPGVCHVCLDEDEHEEDLILQCDSCGIFAHMDCYGVPAAPNGQLWLCDTCEVGPPTPPACALCPVLGGPYKRTECGRWVHPSCVYWIPGWVGLNRDISVMGLQGVVVNMGSIHPERRKLKCQVCKQPYGACIQCCEPGCYAAFHVMCARQAGYAVHTSYDSSDEESDYEEEEEEERVEKDENGGASGSGGGAEAGAAAGGIVEAEQSDDGVAGLALCDESRGSPSCDENGQEVANGAMKDADAAPDATAAAVKPEVLHDSAAAQTTKLAPKKKKKKTQTVVIRGKKKVVAAKQGTYVNGMRMLAYCPKHTPEGFCTSPLKHQHASAGIGGSIANLAAAGIGGAAEGSSGGLFSRADAMEIDTATAYVTEARALKLEKDRAAVMAAAAAGGWPVPGAETPWAAARLMPLGGALRRGPRAPEAMEAAMAKRFYVQATPLLVGGPQPRQDGSSVGGALIESCCTMHPKPSAAPFPSCKVVLMDDNKPPSSAALDASAAEDEEIDICSGSVSPSILAVVKRPQVQEGGEKEEKAIEETVAMMVDAAVAAEHAQERSAGRAILAAAEKLIADSDAAPSSLTPSPSKPRLEADQDELIEFTARRPLSRRSTSTAVLSVTERYIQMRDTEALRIAPGKSAIHGWGAFAKVPHAKDQMVIEYVGDLVRPSVADARERSMHDSIVGAGTYVFAINAEHHVDATRSGNLAHLLNHSCEPNCYSRTVPVWDSQRGTSVDHVIIFAARELQAWEELTYDYRFGGQEKLECNCGAGKCRGMVNQKRRGGIVAGVAERGTMVPLSQVKYVFRDGKNK